MGTNKQAKKQCKKLQKKIGRILIAEKKLTEKIELLKERRQRLEAQVNFLEQKFDEALEQRDETERADADPGRETGGRHKVDWKRYSYLHDRYEAHIEKGSGKAEARKMANLDLIEQFGKEAGYTNQQLKCIFL